MNNEKKLVNIPFTALKDFLFGWEDLENIEIQSKDSGDTAKVVKISPIYGATIKTIDSDEEYFHVEHYFNHSEIWTSKAWTESNTRRNRTQSFSAKDRAWREKNNERLALVQTKLDAFGLNKAPGFTNYLAGLIIKSKNKDDLKLIFQIMDLSALLDEFNKEDKGTT